MKRTVVTAQMLGEMKRLGKSIQLPKDALLTPSARDWLRENRLPIDWQDAPAAGIAGAGKFQAVIDLTVPMQRSLLITLERIVGTAETIDPSDKAGGIAKAVQTLCGAIASGKSNRGVIFADDSSLPACLANKVKGIRAATGTSVQSVEQAVRQFAINVLVIEPSRQTVHQIRQMVERLVTIKPGPAAEANLNAIATMEGATGANR